MINIMEQTGLSVAGVARSGPQDLKGSIAAAADHTGVSFDYLLQTAVKESSMNTSAKASTSSATGAFQFIEQTWLSMIKQHGAEYGLEAEAGAIHKTRTGRFVVPDADQRTAILALREDPAVSSHMAAELAADNQRRMEGALDRKVNDGELYLAHFLGVSGAIRFLEDAAETPNAIASDLFPKEAEANPGVFQDRQTQQERSLQQVLNALMAGFEPQARNSGRSPAPGSGDQTAARGREPQLSSATSSSGFSIKGHNFNAGFNGVLSHMISSSNTGSMNALSPETMAALFSLDMTANLASPVAAVG